MPIFNGKMGADITIKIDDLEARKKLTAFLVAIGPGPETYLKESEHHHWLELDAAIAAAVKKTIAKIVKTKDFEVEAKTFISSDAFDPLTPRQERELKETK